MKKLILFASLVVVLVSAMGIRGIVLKSEASIPKDEMVSEKIEINEELSTEEVEIVEKEETTKQEVASNETKKVEESKPTPTKIETSSPKQESNSSSVPKSEPKTEETIPPKVEEPKQESKVEEDPEYLKLLSQVEYKTYEEAMKVGFAIAEKDTVNIAGFSCPYIVYKGQILGYRLEITYY